MAAEIQELLDQGIASLRAGNRDEARQKLMQVIQADERNESAWLYLSEAVDIAPHNSTNHLFLAETLLKLKKKVEAREELDRVLRATRHALCQQELEKDRRDALRLLRQNR